MRVSVRRNEAVCVTPGLWRTLYAGFNAQRRTADTLQALHMCLACCRYYTALQHNGAPTHFTYEGPKAVAFNILHWWHPEQIYPTVSPHHTAVLSKMQVLNLNWRQWELRRSSTCLGRLRKPMKNLSWDSRSPEYAAWVLNHSTTTVGHRSYSKAFFGKLFTRWLGLIQTTNKRAIFPNPKEAEDGARRAKCLHNQDLRTSFIQAVMRGM